jgi:HprK-related kinase A
MRLGSSLPELVDPVRLLYSRFPVEPDDDLVDFEARVDSAWRGPGRLIPRARTSVDGRREFELFERSQALPMFEWAVNWCVFTRPQRFLLLHSAVVERNGSGLLLSGKPGAGKSTLTSGLIFNGWRLLSDEVAMIPPGSRELLPVPRPVGLKDASIDIVRGLSPDAVLGPSTPGTRKGTVAHLRPPDDSVRRAGERAVPRWIVFPRFERGAPTELRPVSRADALIRSADESFNYSILGSVGFPRHRSIIADHAGGAGGAEEYCRVGGDGGAGGTAGGQFRRGLFARAVVSGAALDRTA